MLRYKFPRTPHHHLSPCQSTSDKYADKTALIGEYVAISLKMDGENTSIYSDGFCHARSINSSKHSSRDWVKAFSSYISQSLEDGSRICGENLFAKHSIHYTELESFFNGFSVFNPDNFCLSFAETKATFEKLGITMPKLLYEGKFSNEIVMKIAHSINFTENEGFVIRAQKEFHYDDYSRNVLKFVRENHVQTDEHWFHKQLIKNEIKQC